MQRFLQFRLGCHVLPIAIATGRLAGAGHVDMYRAKRACLACSRGAIGDEKHMLFECTALQAPLRQQHADLSFSHLALTPCPPS